MSSKVYPDGGQDNLAYQIAKVTQCIAFEWLQTAFDQHDTGILALLVDSRYKKLGF